MRHGVLCILRVHALYGRSRRILGFLLLLGAGSIVAACVSRLLLALLLVYAYPKNVFQLSIKMSLIIIRKTGDETVQIVSPFGGCAQYTSRIGYVADPVSALPSGMTQLITLVVGVYVSDNVTDSLFNSDSKS